MVYGITTAVGDAVKIGFASDRGAVRDRLNALQTGSPMDLSLVALMEGDRQAEAGLHVRFAAWRLRGEWFRLDGDVAQWVVGHPYRPPTKVDSEKFETRMEVRLPSALLERVDAAREFESRSSWVRRALEEKLELFVPSPASPRASGASEEAPSSGQPYQPTERRSPHSMAAVPASPRVSRASSKRAFNPRPKGSR